MFLKIVLKSISLGYLLTFPLKFIHTMVEQFLSTLGSLIIFKNTIALNLIAIGKYYIVYYLLVNTILKELYLSLNLKRNVFRLTEQNIDYGEKVWYFFTPRN